jgi:hypothetical protein
MPIDRFGVSPPIGAVSDEPVPTNSEPVIVTVCLSGLTKEAVSAFDAVNAYDELIALDELKEYEAVPNNEPVIP